MTIHINAHRHVISRMAKSLKYNQEFIIYIGTLVVYPTDTIKNFVQYMVKH